MKQKSILTIEKSAESLSVKISLSGSFSLPVDVKIFEFLAVLKAFLFDGAVQLIALFIEAMDEQVYLEFKETKGAGSAARRKRTLVTSFGKVVCYVRQLKIDGVRFTPVLPLLGIPSKVRILDECCTVPLEACLVTSFRKAHEISGAPFSKTTLWNRFQEKGEKLRNLQDKALEYYLNGDGLGAEPLCELVLIMIDGIWNRSALPRKKDGKDKSDGKKRKSSHFELKTMRVSFGKMEGGKWTWSEPLIYSDRCGSKKFLKDSADYFNATCGLHRAPNILVVSDAANWIKKVSDFYPQAAHQLDWWHIWKNVRSLHFYGDEVYEKVWKALKTDKIDDALAVISEIKANLEEFTSLTQNNEATENERFKLFRNKEKKWLEARTAKLRSLYTYIENNRDFINGIKKLPNFKELPEDARILGSGPEEKLQGVLFGYRMKKQGKSWSPNGARNMAIQLAYNYNGEEMGKRLESLAGDYDKWDALDKELEAARTGKKTPKNCKKPVKKAGKTLKYKGMFQAASPILTRGKKDTGMFDRLSNLKNFSQFNALSL